jgi:DNA-damage-inducible protein J
MDADIKRQFDDFCAGVGMNTSVAVNLFAKAVLREKRIPFEITTAPAPDPFYSAINQKRLHSALEQLNQGQGTMHELIEVEDE